MTATQQQERPAVPRLAYSLDEVAEMCGVSRSTVSRAVAQGALQAKRTAHTGSGRVLFTAKAVEAWLESLDDA